MQVRVISERPRSTVILLTLSDGHIVRRAVAKLRRDHSRVSSTVNRPGMVPTPMPAAEQSALEFDSLRRIESMLDPADPRVGSVRALQQVPTLAGLVMEHLDVPTGRHTLTASSRPGLLLPRSRLVRRVPQLFRHAGVWLSRFHETTDDYELVDRLDTAEKRETLFSDLAAYLEERVGDGARNLGGEAAAAVTASLPATLSLAVGHGDFAVRNSFVDCRGRVYVADPMPRWRSPVLEDLARFMVSVRLQGLQVHTQGLAYSARMLDAREQDFLEGYYGSTPPPGTHLYAYQLLVLFDKWAALVSQRSAPARSPARLRAAAVDRYIVGEGHRLLRLVEAGR